MAEAAIRKFTSAWQVTIARPLDAVVRQRPFVTGDELAHMATTFLTRRVAHGTTFLTWQAAHGTTLLKHNMVGGACTTFLT